MAAKLTGIGGLAVAAIALAEAHAVAAETADPAGEVAPGESVLKGRGTLMGACGCAPCWGPPAPPAFGVAS